MILKIIKKMCKEKEISIHQLEKECGLGNATIRGWEKSSPSVDKLKKVADYFGVSIEELLTEPEEREG